MYIHADVCIYVYTHTYIYIYIYINFFVSYPYFCRPTDGGRLHLRLLWQRKNCTKRPATDRGALMLLIARMPERKCADAGNARGKKRGRGLGGRVVARREECAKEKPTDEESGYDSARGHVPPKHTHTRTRYVHTVFPVLLTISVTESGLQISMKISPPPLIGLLYVRVASLARNSRG